MFSQYAFRLGTKFWRKVKVILGTKLGLWYYARGFEGVPFFRQKNRKGEWNMLPSGTRCYLASYDVFLELQGDRWYATGESPDARRLNSEVDDAVRRAKTFNMDEYLNGVRAESDWTASEIISREMQKAGITEEKFEDMVRSAQKSPPS